VTTGVGGGNLKIDNGKFEVRIYLKKRVLRYLGGQECSRTFEVKWVKVERLDLVKGQGSALKKFRRGRKLGDISLQQTQGEH